MADEDATLAAPPPEPQPGGGDHGDGEEQEENRRLKWIVVGAVLAIGLLIGALVAVLASGGDDESAATDGTTTSSSVTTTTAATSTTTAVPVTSPPTQPPTSPPTTQAIPKPSVTSLSTNPNFIACQQGTSKSVTVSWTTANATSSTLSVDGPGVYGTYGPNASVTLNVGCSAATHTYLVTAKGPGGQAQKQTSLQVTVIPMGP